MNTHPTSVRCGPSIGRRARRAAIGRGVTLMEVLFAILVLAVGLTGVAALLPAGMHHVSVANQYDRSAACGRAALREVEVRRMLWPQSWVNASTLAPPQFLTQAPAFVIDPLLVARNGLVTPNDTRADFFPYASGASVIPAGDPRVLRRRTLSALVARPDGTPLTPRERVAVAERVFVLQDETIFSPPAGDADARPQAIFSGETWPSEGNYSWLLMVRPAESENNASALGVGLPYDQRRLYTVSVIVVRQRNPVIPPNSKEVDQHERQVQATHLGANNFRLAPHPPPNDFPVGRIRIGQWILLTALSNPDPQGVQEPFHRWYRVVSVGQTASGGEVFVKLAGPPWPSPDWLATGNSAVATIVDGAVGVFERTVILDLNAL